MTRSSVWFVAFVTLGWIVLTAGSALADVGKADAFIRDAQKLYFNGKPAEADTTLREAEDLISEALTSSDPAVVKKAKGLEGKANRLRKDIDRKLGKVAGTASVERSIPKPPAGGAPDGLAMPSQVAFRLKGVNTAVDNGKAGLEKGRVSTARSNLDKALEQMREIEERYGGKYPPDHADVIAVKDNLRSFEKMVTEAETLEDAQKADAAAKAEVAVKSSAMWADRLRPYVTGMGRPGYDPKRYFIGSFTEDEKEMSARAALYTEVRARMEAYRAEGPGEDATDDLKEIVRQLDYQLESFTSSLRSGGESALREASTQIEYLYRRSGEEAAKIGTGVLPLPMSKDAIGRSRQLLDQASKILGSDDGRITEAEGQYARILELDGRIRTARLSETRMIPDKFTGKGAGEITDKAKGILAEKKPGVKALRATIVSPDWTEEKVVEWTDTTHSALRHRTTWYVTVQVAGKQGNEAKIYTIHVAKDRRSDGSWSPLYGHIMYEDPILAENVNR